MNYNILNEDFNKVLELIELEETILTLLDGKQKNLYKKAIHKNVIIELYTFWENFVKNIIYSTYTNYKKLIINERFLKKYFKQINENSYVRKKFLENINENVIEITIETLCHSNNLNDSVLRQLLGRINFDVTDLDKHIDSSESLKNSIEELKASFIKPIKREEINEDSLEESYQVTPEKEQTITELRFLDQVNNYLYTLIELRNEVSHSYNITEIYNLYDLKMLAKFIFELCVIVLEFIGSQLIKKSISSNQDVIHRLYPIKVFKNSSSGLCIVGINNFTREIIEVEEYLFMYSRGKKIYKFAKIESIKSNEDFINELLPYHTAALKLKTDAVIRSEHKTFHLYSLKSFEDEFEYKLIL